MGSEKTHLVTLVPQQPEGVRRCPAHGIGPTLHEQEDDAIGLIDNAIVGSVTSVTENSIYVVELFLRIKEGERGKGV